MPPSRDSFGRIRVASYRILYHRMCEFRVESYQLKVEREPSAEMLFAFNFGLAAANFSQLPHVRGPKRATDAELTIVPARSDNHVWGQPSGGNRVWRQNRTQSSRPYRERCGATWEESSAR